MWVKNVFKSWNLDTFKELLKYNKRQAYEYRKRILGTEIPDNHLTDAEKLKKGIEITETPEEIMNAVEDDAFEDEEPGTEIIDDMGTPEETVVVDLSEKEEANQEQAQETIDEITEEDITEIEEEPETKIELKRWDMMKMLKKGWIKFKGNASNADLFELCENNKLL